MIAVCNTAAEYSLYSCMEITTVFVLDKSWEMLFKNRRSNFHLNAQVLHALICILCCLVLQLFNRFSF
ncbi:hypothetical protein AB205_0077820 [Aquarana catesbeiana]|uniref:Uncharacterized protein n=1 Tax=Aquarana catesbeiana TaxID=8400 RepID=A0A2G9RZA3_AQUCT|nr:hypothetical protein AB205_0077820 [Aquarana catesbeiana]